MTTVDSTKQEVLPPFRHVPYAPLDLDIDRRDDGVITIGSNVPLEIRHEHFPAYLAYHAEKRPDYPWLAQRESKDGDWVELSFAEAKRRVDCITQTLLDIKIPAGRTLTVLSGNSIDHALMILAGMQAQVPVVSISVAYSLLSHDHAKLKEVTGKAIPGAIFVQNAAMYSKALASLGLDVPVIDGSSAQSDCISLKSIYELEPTEAVASSIASIDPHSTARIMFTSGSTGSPKGVPLTHIGLVSMAESNCVSIGALQDGSCVRVDWMPWSHVFGATTLNVSVVNGGTLYIDEGKPIPALFGETVRNIADVQPELIMNVPAAINMLVEAMEKDDALAARILEKLTALGYGGASLSNDIVERFQKLAIQHTGSRITVTCGYGTTETGPGGGFVYWLTGITGTIGLPHPGYSMKLVPLEAGRYEVRVKGPSVMKGYIGQPELNKTVFGDEGFYRTGDCVVFVEDGKPEKGLAFAGRLNEEFKLQSGTFVRVGAVREKAIDALSPFVRAIVICGENQTELGALIWLNDGPAKALIGNNDATMGELCSSKQITDKLKELMAVYNAANSSSSTAIKRFRLLEKLPSIDLGEVTDKGSINQRSVQRHRADDLKALFAVSLDERTIIV